MAKIYIGISGWRYAPWRGTFYPKGLRQADELAFASRALPSIELNGSFYALQKPESYNAWYQATPPDLVFSTKGNRFITHIRRLRDIETPLANVFASGVFSKSQKLRHAMEIRNDSFTDPSFVALLRKYRVALVVADTAGKWPDREDVTADFMYLRLHGEAELYSGGYTEEALDYWAERIREWSSGSQPEGKLISDAKPPKRTSRDIYCYFDNDIKVDAPFDARRLIDKLGLKLHLTPVGAWGKVDGSRSIN